MDSQTESKLTWRSSRALLLFTATLGLFTENFLYGFIVPILPYMIEQRLGLDPSYTQRATTEFLSILGLISLPAAPIIGHFADQTPSRKWPLLILLVGCAIGTVLVMTTLSIWAILVGRAFQAIAGTGVWIVGFSMMTDAIDKENVGRTLGLAMSFTTTGVIAGPAVGGLVLQWVGYWPAWSVPIALLALDFAARLAVIEPKKIKKSAALSSATATEAMGTSEVTPLISSTNSVETVNNIDQQETPERKRRHSSLYFYRIMLSNPSVLAGLFNVIVFSITVASFDATFPLHLRDTFGWSSAPTGALFLALMVPGLFLSPLIGALRDRGGLKYPTAIGCALLVPIEWFMGFPGHSNWPGLGKDQSGQAAFVGLMVALGFVLPLVRGAGILQLTTTLNELQAKDPEIFGPHGGSSRIYSLTEMAFNVGLLLGPIIGGSLVESLGFFYCNCVLAVLSAIAALSSLLFLTSKGKRSVESASE